MKDLGNIKWILGTAVQYNQKTGTMNLSQRAYIETVAKKFGFDDLDRTRKYIPMSANDARIFTKHAELERLKGVKECDATKYRGLVGALLYLSRATRPDIEVAVHMCTCASKRPTIEHMKIAEGILKYCVTTRHLPYFFETDSIAITSYMDADYATREQDSRSRTGYCYRIGSELSRSAMCTYKTRLQRTPALSTMESEYMAASDACTEIFDARENLSCYGRPQRAANGRRVFSLAFCDSKSAIACAREPKVHQKTKSIRTRYHSIRMHASQNPMKIVELIYISTHENPADLFTKILPRPKFELFRDQIMNITKRTKAITMSETTYVPKV